ncbi:hypothetical protein HID58_029732 [Brassica napus]|uniref:Uncharacterized protein n=1 Tax=Brassica napus TaxID=3708 RepID=A0ABQ8CDY1_BRANA|nr:hypothetical protein HID58_029732 [Brassica napus]
MLWLQPLWSPLAK